MGPRRLFTGLNRYTLPWFIIAARFIKDSQMTLTHFRSKKKKWIWRKLARLCEKSLEHYNGFSYDSAVFSLNMAIPTVMQSS